MGTGLVAGTVAVIGFSVHGSGSSTRQVAVHAQASPTIAALQPDPTVTPSAPSVHLGYLSPGVQYDSTHSNPRKGGLLYDPYTIPGPENVDTMPPSSSDNRADGTQHPTTQLIVSKQSNIAALPASPADPRFNLVAEKTVRGQTYRLTNL